MKPKTAFYIGWQDSMPADHKLPLRRFLLIAFGLMIVFACVLVMSQNPFASSKYQIGEIIEEEGYLYSKPRPTLVQVNGDGVRTSMLLVSYGKIGADEDLQNWFDDHPQAEQGALVKIRGTAATFQDETVLELT